MSKDGKKSVINVQGKSYLDTALIGKSQHTEGHQSALS